MAIIAGRSNQKRAIQRKRRSTLRAHLSHIALATLIAFPVLAVTARPTHAQTTGIRQGVVDGGTVLRDLIGAGGLSNAGNPPTAVSFSNSGYTYIKNPYIAVAQGISGGYTVNFGNNLSVGYNAPGMLSFGNQSGALSYATDDFQAMNGLNFTDALSGGKPLGYGVWPLPGHWQGADFAGFVSYDYSAYTRVQIDNTVVPILGGDTATLSFGPVIENNVLRTVYLLANNIQIEQQIRLYNQTAQIRWIVTNLDTAGHAVSLRFTVCNRAAAFTGATGGGPNGFYFVDPQRGVSDKTTVLQGANIPSSLNIYGKRYETDSTLNPPTDPPFAVRHIFRDFGATLPTQVYLTSPFELRPEGAGFAPQLSFGDMADGIATAAYYGPLNLPAGGSSTITTYYGNGVPTEQLDNNFVVGAEGPESLAYNSAAPLDAALAGVVNPDPATVATKFLSPNPFRVYGELYNLAVGTNQTSVNLDGVTASLVLPSGLDFGIDTATGVKDVSEKSLGSGGTVASDRAVSTNWLVQPIGTAYGLLTYQVSFKTQNFGSKQVSRTISIPATPFKTLSAAGYQMIGFPFDFDPALSNNGDPSTVINGSSSPRDDSAAFFKYDPKSGDYLPPVTKLETGVGYFTRPSFNRTIYARGVMPVPGQAPLGVTDTTGAQQRQISLFAGWNMISNPYLYEIPLKRLRFAVSSTNPTGGSQFFDQAVTGGLVRAGVFFYNSTTKSYDFFQNSDQTLKPWESYWIFVNNDVELIYTLPAQRLAAVLPGAGGVEPPTRAQGAIQSGKAFVTNPTQDNWRLHLVARQSDGQQDAATVIGVTSGDEAEATRLLPKPPAPVSDYVYVGVVHPNVKGRFAKDVQTGAGSKTWDVEVTSDHDGPVTLTWPNVNTLPKQVGLTVTNTATGKSYPLRNTSQITVDVRKGQPTRLQIVSKKLATQRLQITGLTTAPIGTRSEGGRSFVFNLNRDASVTLQIKTVTGKVVATAVTGRATTAGQNSIKWTGRAQDGSPLPPGMYKVQVTAHSDNGDEAPVTVVQTFSSIQ